jgi:hypothetical protein
MQRSLLSPLYQPSTQWLSFNVAIAAGPRLHCSPPSCQLTHSCCSTHHYPMPESLFLVGKARSSSIQTSALLSSSSFIQPAVAWWYNASNLGNHWWLALTVVLYRPSIVQSTTRPGQQTRIPQVNRWMDGGEKVTPTSSQHISMKATSATWEDHWMRRKQKIANEMEQFWSSGSMQGILLGRRSKNW